jgi:HD domain
MSDAIRFLHALAQALSMTALYAPGHPATKRGSENLWQTVTALLAADPHPVFLFLGTAPVYAGRALHELRDWQHSGRLATVGVQRLEFDATVTLESLTWLVEILTARLATGEPAPNETAPPPGIVFGVVAVQDQAAQSGEAAAEAAADVEQEIHLDLQDELDAMLFVRGEATRGVVARAEADAVARILGGLVDRFHLPQAIHSGRGLDRDHAVYPVNTALLAMTAAAADGVDASGRHRIGVVALLHDIGMALLPSALADRDDLSDAERTQFETHTVRGAELLLREGGVGFELAATVAFEHHLRPAGTGFPVRRFAPAPHWASSLVACCSAFAALRIPRPSREEWSVERALRYIDDGAGTIFDAEIAALVASVVRAA